jgi:hypothetical protein
VATLQVTVVPRRIADSRGDPTVEVELTLDGIRAVGRAPAGMTKGGDEALTVPVEEALATIQEVIRPMVRQAATRSPGQRSLRVPGDAGGSPLGRQIRRGPQRGRAH